jgi:hypothetical protein
MNRSTLTRPVLCAALPDGCVLVFDLLEARSEDGATTEGARRCLGVMEKDAKRFPTTKGWGFEVFPGGSPTSRGVTDGSASCFECHIQVSVQDYVFSRWRR